jgi:hypothetical protein
MVRQERGIAVSGLVVLLAGAVYSQSTTATPEFNVVNVQLSKLGLIEHSTDFLPSGQVNLRNLTMKQLIVLAYREIFNSDYAKGGPDWLNLAHYEVDAEIAMNIARNISRAPSLPFNTGDAPLGYTRR